MLFRSKGNLTAHINLVHLKLREHACPYCPGVGYQTNQHLTRHIDLVHLKLREHACPYCPGVAFQTKSHLKTHIHRDGAREAQGPRLRLLQGRGVREGQHPEEAHRCDPLEDQTQQRRPEAQSRRSAQ